MEIRFKWVSALEKVFPDTEPMEEAPNREHSALQGETLSLQAVYSAEGSHDNPILSVQTDCPLPVRVREVVSVPVRFACFPETSGAYLRRTPGLYPDILRDIQPKHHLRFYPGCQNALWLDLEIDPDQAPGVYPLSLSLLNNEGKVLGELKTTFRVVDAKLPKQKLLHTRWLHLDCIAQSLKVPVFSEKHWDGIASYVRLAAKRGMNMILTPVHTPPLDTAFKHERPTVQLVGITRVKGQYEFNFELLRRFVSLCQSCGISHFEIAPLFTQWGAYHAPKIMGTEDGELKRLFGWETEALSPEYTDFLKAYLPALYAEFERLQLLDRCYFHLSDEPSAQHIAQYLKLKALVAPLIPGAVIMDALSDPEFYVQGAVEHPVPAIDHLEAFLSFPIPELWTYYCVAQHQKVSNTFLSMPASRTRVLGLQLYKYRVKGFLHWAFNFYFSQFSDYPLNPYSSTDCDGFAPAGDAFQVYPGLDGEPEESLRLMYFSQAMQDLRALELYESLYGRDAALKLINQGLDTELSLTEYPADEAYYLELREKLNRALDKPCGN